MDAVAPVYRLLELARDAEKPEKTIKFIESRLAELQELNYGVTEE